MTLINYNLTTSKDLVNKLQAELSGMIQHFDLGSAQQEVDSIINSLLPQIQAVKWLEKEKKQIYKQLRFMVLILNKRAPDMDLTQIVAVAGKVPVLNKQVQLPELLPPRYASTCANWAGIGWKDRSECNEVKLIERRANGKAIAAARLELILKDSYLKDEKGLGLSYVDCDFHPYGQLHVDHLQPSSNLVARQLELVEAMNLDPKFKENMLTQANGLGYFIEEAGKIVGTKKFFMEYNNDIRNLWFISGSANLEKANKDPLAWLAEHPAFGADFFLAIGGRNTINTETILYTTAQGVPLAKAAKDWYKDKNTYRIQQTYQAVTEIVQPLKALFATIEQARSLNAAKSLLGTEFEEEPVDKPEGRISELTTLVVKRAQRLKRM